MPDCVLSVGLFTGGNLRDAALFKERDPLEQQQAEPGEARDCTRKDMRSAAQFYAAFGSDVVTGVVMGGKILEFKTTLSPGTATSANNKDAVPSVDDMLQKERAAQRSASHKTVAGRSFSKFDPRSADVGAFSSTQRNARFADFPQFQKRMAEVEHEHARYEQKVHAARENPGNFLGDKVNNDGVEINPMEHDGGRTKRRRLRRLLGRLKTKPGQVDNDKNDNPVLSHSFMIDGYADFPVEAGSFLHGNGDDQDLSLFWSVSDQDAWQSVMRTTLLEPLPDLFIKHMSVIKYCVSVASPSASSSSSLPPRQPKDVYKTRAGRALVRRSVFYRNFLIFLDLKSADLFAQTNAVEDARGIFDRKLGMVVPLVREFDIAANRVDEMKASSKGGAMWSPMAAWTRLRTLSTIGKDPHPLLSLLAVGAKQYRLRFHITGYARQYCEARGRAFILAKPLSCNTVPMI
jgi:hypothetical protein